MVTAAAMAASPVPVASALKTAFGIIELVVLGGWAILIAIMIGLLVIITVTRGARERRKQRNGASALAPREPSGTLLPGQLARFRRADPDFDEQFLLEAAEMACLLVFAAMSTGDEEPIRHITAPSFWPTRSGRGIEIIARDVRQQYGGTGAETASGSQARLPLDYQATAPELVSLELGDPQLARVRVAFSQLGAIVAASAAGQAAMASARNLTSLATGLGGAVGARMNYEPAGVSWVSWAGRYDLHFTRPAYSRTDPAAALASRTCTTCGAAYRSELATTCAHCAAPRPAAWGSWQLTQITLADDDE